MSLHSGQGWVAEAIAAQEEHIKRSHSCTGRPCLPHRFVERAGWRECESCGVTASNADYEKKRTAVRSQHDAPSPREGGAS